MVAPHVGAWIETYHKYSALFWIVSHPTWVRGLKLLPKPKPKPKPKSHPTWVRGLKQLKAVYLHYKNESHPTWVRGLKLVIVPVDTVARAVAPHVGAWIETTAGRCSCPRG